MSEFLAQTTEIDFEAEQEEEIGSNSADFSEYDDMKDGHCCDVT
jgi:hypothetical protein